MNTLKIQSKSRLKISLFVNYLIHGIALTILAQNITQLSEIWQKPLVTATYVLSGTGIGRLIAYIILGYLSDKIGRKNILIFGMTSYLIFFIATPINQSITIAYFLAILAGISNSALDSATYPIFSDLKNDNSGSTNSILIKSCMSIGEFILPLFVVSLHSTNQWFGWSFIIPATILLINLINISMIKFPNKNVVEENEELHQTQLSKAKRIALTILFIIFGYTSMALMLSFIQWITLFASNVLHYNMWISHLLLSAYSLGSIAGSISMFFILKKPINRKNLMLLINVVAGIMITGIFLIHNPIISIICSFGFGFTAASGVMQMGLEELLTNFIKRKGLMTGIFFMAGSIASFTVPIITGKLTSINLNAVMLFALIINLISIIVILIANFIKTDSPNELIEARQNINQIDQKLAKLINQRFEEVQKVNNYKQENNLPILDETRENDVLKSLHNKFKNSKFNLYSENIFKNIMSESKKFQKNNQN
ncbi:MFS transporter [Lactobacillus sp. S2-2]|uniref:MFS transporter n=1 Tax=Lactobacillus sp. S2-2 TaxID=2692917 RepID=UPI001F02B216|nr:MFS transporter [Lactobacillus sp. S2-2]MCF6514607.1 MFS transporter [Lactobacillus sp. S2-2]